MDGYLGRLRGGIRVYDSEKRKGAGPSRESMTTRESEESNIPFEWKSDDTEVRKNISYIITKFL